MKCIIPLAGPDIFTIKYGIKPAYEIDGEPLLVKAVHSRSWYNYTLHEEDLIFVIREFERLVELQKLISNYFPKAQQVILPGLTRGALMSCLAGISLVTDFLETIIVDLVDIFFNADFDPDETFHSDNNIEGIIPYFKSENPKYSYLELDTNKNVLHAREKEVISDNASAGVYFFRQPSSLLKAASYSLENERIVAFNNLMYLCPSFNGLIHGGSFVRAVMVNTVRDISTIFH